VIFLDVGAHDGQTLEEVVKPVWGFDRIWSFEPMPAQYSNLVRSFGGEARVELCDYGLAAATGTMAMFGGNDRMEASVYPAKNDVDASVVTECRFVEASEFFRAAVPAGEPVIVKLNCEGSEVAILNNLLDSGEISKVTDVMIDFDVRKVVGMEHHEAGLLSRFRTAGFTNFSLSDDVMVGATHQARIGNWLRSLGTRLQ
jgi:FkbM family methyltransferase